MDLNDIVVFAKVVDAGSFVGAARDTGIPKSTVSRKVSELESRLGARLLQRTTRSLTLTDVGQTFYRHAQRVVSEVEAAEHAVSAMQQTPRGLVRVTMPLNFGFAAPIVASFMRQYPEVQVEIVGTDRVVDLVAEGFDVAIRAGELDDSSLVARRLGKLETYLVASPAFLRRHGAPKQPRDVEQLDCIVFGAGRQRMRWQVRCGSKTQTITPRPRMTVNDFEFLEAGARAGLGVAMLPVFRCIDALRRKQLRRVLPKWCARESPLHAVYPTTRHLSPAVKALLEHLRAELTPPPWERGPKA